MTAHFDTMRVAVHMQRVLVGLTLLFLFLFFLGLTLNQKHTENKATTKIKSDGII